MLGVPASSFFLLLYTTLASSFYDSSSSTGILASFPEFLTPTIEYVTTGKISRIQ
jgi:hypothetical protein